MEINELQKICKTVRRDIITSVTAAKSGHPGGSLSAVEILVALYFQEMKVDTACVENFPDPIDAPVDPLGSAGPLRPLQGTCSSRTLRGPCGTGVL